MIPFLTIYLVKELGYTADEAKWVMVAYGGGAVLGTFLGGILTDKLGSYRVQVGSLIATGLYFFLLYQFTSLIALIIGVFLLSVVADVLRPANGASIGYYARKENLTKAFSLNRLAINLGYSVGPFAGGLLIGYGYHVLFYVDGITCIIAGLVFGLYFRQRRKREEQDISTEKASQGAVKSIFKDKPMLIFLISNVLFSVVFFQILFTLPLYYTLEDGGYGMSEEFAGAMIGFNGLLIFLLEMVIVDQWGHKRSVGFFTVVGTLLAGISLTMLNLHSGIGWLILSMIVLSLAEIFAIPFAVSLVSKRSSAANRGKYMSYYSMSFAAGRIFASLFGLGIVASYGFRTLWWFSGALSIIAAIGFFYSSSILESRSLKVRERVVNVFRV